MYEQDALVITAGGAEMLPFLSTYVVLPLSLGFFSLYSKLCDAVPPRHVFYYTVSALLTCYVAFVAVYPFHHLLHPTGLSALVSGMPSLLGLVRVFENWTFSLFFGTAELWGTISIRWEPSLSRPERPCALSLVLSCACGTDGMVVCPDGDERRLS